MGPLRTLGSQTMLGFSFSKILFTIVMIIAVWWIYNQINRLTDGSGKQKSRVKSKGNGARGSAQEATSEDMETVEDLTACPACGTYVAVGSNPGCGRPAKDCPMHR